MRVTNNILEIINSITMDSTLVITGRNGRFQNKYKIVKATDDSLDIVPITNPDAFWNGGFETIEEVKNYLVADIALGKIKEIDVLKR